MLKYLQTNVDRRKYAMTQKEQAQAILTQFGLLKYLNTHCGATHVIGSYAMDLMVANDLDVDVENHTMSQEKL